MCAKVEMRMIHMGVLRVRYGKCDDDNNDEGKEKINLIYQVSA